MGPAEKKKREVTKLGKRKVRGSGEQERHGECMPWKLQGRRKGKLSLWEGFCLHLVARVS